jgi:hypothetical protein
MTSEHRAQIELHEDLEFQRKQFRVERIGWILMAAVLVAALLGVFGSGPLSNAIAESSESGLRVEYSRFARRDAHTRVEIHVDPSLVAKDRLRLRLGGDFMQRVLVQAITPTPERWTVEDRTIVAELPVGGSTGPVPVAVDFSPREFGPTTLELSAGPGRALTIRQFVYP